jgi:membrane fusion protein (multidrug efflux system)
MYFSAEEMLVNFELTGMPVGTQIPVTVGGYLANGQWFQGEDMLTIIAPPPTVNLSVRSNLPDAWVETWPRDVAMDSDGWTNFDRLYPQGTAVTLQAAIVPYGHFMGWRVNGHIVNPGNPVLTVNLSQSQTVWACTSSCVPPRPTASSQREGILPAPVARAAAGAAPFRKRRAGRTVPQPPRLFRMRASRTIRRAVPSAAGALQRRERTGAESPAGDPALLASLSQGNPQSPLHGRAGAALRPQVLALAGALLASCAPKPEQAQAPARTIEVSVVTLQPRTVPNVLEFIGQTAAYQTVEIRSRVAGFLLKQAYVDGDKVKQGQLLFEIDPKPFQAQVDVNKAQLTQAKARLANAKVELARQKQLLESGATPQKEYDTAETSELTASAEVELQSANLTVAELDLSYTSIASPVNGRAGERLLDVGSYVSAGSNALLTTCQQTDPISAYFTISERDILRFREQVAKQSLVLPEDGQIAVQLVLVDGSVYDKLGKIDFRDIQIDPTTGTARMRAQFANPDEALKPGMFVKCRGLGIDRPNSLLVPQRCVLQSPAGAVVYVVGEGGRGAGQASEARSRGSGRTG